MERKIKAKVVSMENGLQEFDEIEMIHITYSHYFHQM